MEKITKNILKEVYKERSSESKKYDNGLMLVIGGGQFYTGSPALAALSGFRAGVDMVQILAPQRAADIIACFSPNLAAYPLQGKWLDREDLPTLLSMTEGAQSIAGEKSAVVIGGGIGRSERTKETVIEYLSQIKVKKIIDADGIHALAQKPEMIKGNNFLITPHAFEFSVLTGKNVKDLSFEEKINIVKEEAKRLGCVILLKGKEDIISDGENIAINKTGSPYLAVGGTGDTLAGICGSLVAQGADLFSAAKAAAFINGKAGEIAAKKLGISMTAVDLIDAIAEAIKL